MDNYTLAATDPKPLTLTVPQTAELLQIGKNQVYELIHAGRLPAIRLGNKFLVVTEVLHDWLEREVELQRAERTTSAWQGQP